MDNKLKTLDFERTIGEVTLSDGETKLSVPKLSMLKIIKIVKFIGVDGSRLYDGIRDVLRDDSYAELEKIAIALEMLDEEQLIRILSILLELEDKETLQLDPDETLDVLLVYSEKINIANLYSKVRQLTMKMFNKELPDFKVLMNRIFPEEEEGQETETVGKNS